MGKTLALSIICSKCMNEDERLFKKKNQCALAAGIKKYKSIIKKKKKKLDKIELLAKSKLNNIEVLISKAFIDSNISHDEFVLINNQLKENDRMKK